MKFNDKVTNWIIGNNKNLFLVLFLTAACPKSLIRSVLENKKKKLWKNKKACLTISFDCDYPRDVEAMPAIIKTLHKYKFKTSFACVGNWIEKYPGEHKMILDYGHEIVNHTYSHPDNEILNPGRRFKDISRAEKLEEISKCHDICRKTLNYEPIGCRIPHFGNLFTDEIYGILSELGYKYSSSTMITNTISKELPFMAKDGIYEFPLTTCPKHPFTVFDTWHMYNSDRLFYNLLHGKKDEYVSLFKYLIDLAVYIGSYINIYIDPYDVQNIKGFDALLNYLKEKEEDIWVAGYDDIMQEIKEV
jgi:peptidoglycan/xylan/chitin deacetylase (PgdA/CDA1 family)